ncbi:MAG: hypothetical protein K2X99_11005 [Gemmatimonadaceae bacterium]|nr:hypothetical protein [Gemmatimonadaceae bacterium]
MAREYKFIADTDSLEVLRKLRRGWAGWLLHEGRFYVRLRDGMIVEVSADHIDIEPDFDAHCLVAELIDAEKAPEIPARDSAFTSSGNDLVVFRGITWLERRPDLGADTTMQFSGSPMSWPEAPEAICEVTDAIAAVGEGGQIVVRLALKPGALEVMEDDTATRSFLEQRGYLRPPEGEADPTA